MLRSPRLPDAMEKWQKLCEQVIVERDPKRLTEFVAMLNNQLEQREAAKKTPSGQQSPSKNGGV